MVNVTTTANVNHVVPGSHSRVVLGWLYLVASVTVDPQLHAYALAARLISLAASVTVDLHSHPLCAPDAR
jgi:hypothetical protein